MIHKKMWKQKMGHITSMTLDEAFEIYLECGVILLEKKVVPGKKYISQKNLTVLNEIYKQTNYSSCNPYKLNSFSLSK